MQRGLIRQRKVTVGVPAREGLGLPAVIQPLPSVLAQRLKQPVVHTAIRLLLRLHQRLLHQPRQEVKHLVLLDPLAGADGLGRL
jgi:hypothetical protein